MDKPDLEEIEQLEESFSKDIICESRYGCDDLAEWVAVAPVIFDDGRKHVLCCDKHRVMNIAITIRDRRTPCIYLSL